MPKAIITIPDDTVSEEQNRRDAEQYRLLQAMQILRFMGYHEDKDGNFSGPPNPRKDEMPRSSKRRSKRKA